MTEDYSMKNSLLVFIAAILIISCKEDRTLEYYAVSGETMGTYYQIKYADKKKRNLNIQIDSILNVVNASLSTYIDDSYISIINRSGKSNMTMPFDSHFLKMYTESVLINKISKGLYDPTIMPVINYYGFGWRERVLRDTISPEVLDSLVSLVGLQKISITKSDDSLIIKRIHPQVQLDYSAIAKGYAIDLISDFLVSQDCKDHLVDIGGDGLAMGKSPSQKPWVIGINKPLVDSPLNDFALTINLENKALATSGNYRNYYEVGDKRYAHTMSPIDGKPIFNSIMSVSVIADDCLSADAYATACMAMGLEQSKTMIDNISSIEACWIYRSSQDTSYSITYSSGFEKYINK